MNNLFIHTVGIFIIKLNSLSHGVATTYLLEMPLSPNRPSIL